MNKNTLLDEGALFKVTKILTEKKIIWWIDHGTLLGYVRDGEPIEWDRDFDLGTAATIEELIDIVLPVIRAEFPCAYIDSMANALKVQFMNHEKISWSIDIASYYLIAGKAIKYWPNLANASWQKKLLATIGGSLCGRKLDKSDKLVIKIIYIVFNPIRFILRSMMNDKKIHRVILAIKSRLPYTKNSVDASHFKEIKILKIGDKKINIPSDHENYLKKRYGDTWKTPLKQWNFLKDDASNIGLNKRLFEHQAEDL